MRTFVLTCLVACSGSAHAPIDAAVVDPPTSDAVVDSARDTPFDAPGDAPIDALSNAPIDAPTDAAIDSPIDGPGGCTWQVETVATSNSPDKTVIAVAPDGRVDVLFHDAALCGSLRHASKAPGALTWSDEVLDSQLGSLFQIYAMTSDANGDLHAAYYGGPDTNPPCVGGNAHTIYAHASRGVWGRTAMTTGRRGWALAIDTGGGQAHVAYIDQPDALGYAHGTLAGMTLETVPTMPIDDPIGTMPSLRVDPSGIVHVASMRNTGNTPDDAIVYVERSTAGVWSAATTIDSGQGLGNTSSIDVDAAGGVHVAYWTGATLALGYAYRPAGGSWSTTRLDTDRVSPHPALRVDEAGVLHVLYVGESRVRHAHAVIGQAWTVEPVGDDTGSFGTSLALGPNGELHVAYTQGQLVRHASRVCR